MRCLVRLSGPGENPEDVYQNTWFLNVPEPTTLADAADAATPRFTDFYQGLAGNYSNCVQTPGEIRFYNMADAPIRQPEIRSLGYAGGQPPGLLGLPEEIAVCLTMHGSNPKERRGRGRLYLGPLNQSVLSQVAGGPCQVDVVLINSICARATAFKNDTGRGGFWVVTRQPANTWTTVVGGWVDNAFDIQRRRGGEATSRVQWT